MTFKYKINEKNYVKSSIKERRSEFIRHERFVVGDSGVNEPGAVPDGDLVDGILEGLSTGNVFVFLDSMESDSLYFILYFFTKLINKLDDKNHYDCVKYFIEYITTIEENENFVKDDNNNNLLKFVEENDLGKFVGSIHDELFVFTFIRVIFELTINESGEELMWKMNNIVSKIFEYYKDCILFDFYINTIYPKIEKLTGLSGEPFSNLLCFYDLFKPSKFLADYRLQYIVLNKIKNVDDYATLSQSVFKYKV